MTAGFSFQLSACRLNFAWYSLLCFREGVCVFVRACVRARVHMCVLVCLLVCLHVGACACLSASLSA